MNRLRRIEDEMFRCAVDALLHIADDVRDSVTVDNKISVSRIAQREQEYIGTYIPVNIAKKMGKPRKLMWKYL